MLGRDVGEVRDADAVDEHAEAADARPERVERRPLPALRPPRREERADLGRAPSRQPAEGRFPGDDGPAEIVRDALVALPRGRHGPAAAREVAARRRDPRRPRPHAADPRVAGRDVGARGRARQVAEVGDRADGGLRAAVLAVPGRQGVDEVEAGPGRDAPGAVGLGDARARDDLRADAVPAMAPSAPWRRPSARARA